jgi:hypothetical protein
MKEIMNNSDQFPEFQYMHVYSRDTRHPAILHIFLAVTKFMSY